MGTLFILSTPIGNLGDITFRAIEVLKEVDYILCEDTRVTGRLLHNYEIDKKMVSFNDFNEESKTPSVIADLLDGKKIALVSDAGTPLISDPGYKLVREVINSNINVDSIPGPTAVTVALTLSGLPPDKFLFLGYLPRKEGRRLKMLKILKESSEGLFFTKIIFESPHRVLKTLKDIREIFGDIEVVVCRELTKIHQEVKKGSASYLISVFNEVKIKGELVLLF